MTTSFPSATIATWPRDRREGLAAYLGRFITDNRRDTMRAVLAKRTRHIAVVLENVYQPHNASAVIRSCEIFGIQDLHVIEDRNAFRPNQEITMGAGKWVDLYRHRPAEDGLSEPGAVTAECLDALRARGYAIAVTALREDAIPLCETPLDRKLALVFGTEADGISDAALARADHVVRIPMYGFTQSFNISVSAALCLYDLTTRLRAGDGRWRLSPDERLDLEIAWLRHSLARSDDYIRRFAAETGIRDGLSEA